MPQPKGARFCGQCGGLLKENAKFCGACGQPTPRSDLDESAPTAEAAQLKRATTVSKASATETGLRSSVSDRTPPLPPLGPSSEPETRDLRGKLLIGLLAVVAIGGITATVVLLLHSHTKTVVIHPHPSSTTTLVPPTSTSSTSNLQSQQAAALNGLLAQSSSDRNAIDNATSDIRNCGNLAQNQATLQTAAQSRQTILNQLSQLDTSQLPNSSQLISSLTTAWQASLQSDNSYATWAGDLIQSGCVGQASTDDASWQAAQTSDTAATAAKNQFVAAWNPLAATFGLPQYQENQI